ncbi:MAG: hypothetical protein ACRC11_11030 [Xenococcaceae cyanobacterium]
MELTPEQNKQLLTEIISTIYTDGVDEIEEYYHDEEQNLLWGTFIDNNEDLDEPKKFKFEIDLENGTISY